MTSDERARFEILLESIDSKVQVIAEGHGALAAGQADIKADLAVIAAKVDRLDLRVQRVEHHLGLNGVHTSKRPARKPRK